MSLSTMPSKPPLTQSLRVFTPLLRPLRWIQNLQLRMRIQLLDWYRTGGLKASRLWDKPSSVDHTASIAFPVQCTVPQPPRGTFLARNCVWLRTNVHFSWAETCTSHFPANMHYSIWSVGMSVHVWLLWYMMGRAKLSPIWKAELLPICRTKLSPIWQAELSSISRTKLSPFWRPKLSPILRLVSSTMA